MEEQLSSAAQAIDPEKILRDLRDLWAQLAQEQGGAGRRVARVLDDPDRGG